LYTCENQRNIKQGNIARKYTDWLDSEHLLLLAKNRKGNKRNTGRPCIFSLQNEPWILWHIASGYVLVY